MGLTVEERKRERDAGRGELWGNICPWQSVVRLIEFAEENGLTPPGRRLSASDLHFPPPLLFPPPPPPRFLLLFSPCLVPLVSLASDLSIALTFHYDKTKL